MRMTAPALRQVGLIVTPEGFGHAANRPALVALHFHVGSLTRHAQFVHPQRPLAVGLAPVDEIQPREIVQMPVRAGRQETGGNDRWRCPCVEQLWT